MPDQSFLELFPKRDLDPESWSVQEFSVAMGYSIQQSNKILDDKVKDGVAEKALKRNANGRVVQSYRLKK